MNVGTRTTRRGEGLVLGSPGVYHYAFPHEWRPSTQYGFGQEAPALCGRVRGIVYADHVLRGLWPNDRLCKFCERRATS